MEKSNQSLGVSLNGSIKPSESQRGIIKSHSKPGTGTHSAPPQPAKK